MINALKAVDWAVFVYADVCAYCLMCCTKIKIQSLFFIVRLLFRTMIVLETVSTIMS